MLLVALIGSYLNAKQKREVFAVDGYEYIFDYSQSDFFRVRAVNIVYDKYDYNVMRFIN